MEDKYYYPSNSTEGMGFEKAFCNQCYREPNYNNTDEDIRFKKHCKILMNALFEGNCKHWIYNNEGNPICVKFESRQDYYKRTRKPRIDKNQLTLL